MLLGFSDMEFCNVHGCEKVAHSRGICGSHYQRLRVSGDVKADIPLGVGRCFVWLMDNCRPGHDGCVIWPFSLTPQGYGQISVRGKNSTAHREVCILTNGHPDSPDLQAAHSCGNRACVNSKHLRWATALENAADRVIHGTHFEGEDVKGAKLTNEQAAMIRNDTRKQRDIAESYGVTQKVISLIKRGKSYKAALGMS